MKNNKNILIIIFTTDFYKFYYALNLASTYQACNKKVTVYFTGYSCNFLKKKWKRYDKSKNEDKFKETKMISYIGILDLCMELNVKFYFCDTAMKFLNIEESEFIEGLNIKALPLYHIINVHKDNKTFFI